MSKKQNDARQSHQVVGLPWKCSTYGVTLFVKAIRVLSDDENEVSEDSDDHEKYWLDEDGVDIYNIQ